MPKSHAAIIPKNIFGASPHLQRQAPVSTSLIRAAAMDAAALYEQFASRPEGLSAGQAQVRLKKHGPNVLAQDQRPGIATILFHSVLNPIVILLAVLSSVSVATGDYRAASMMIVMIIIGFTITGRQRPLRDSEFAYRREFSCREIRYRKESFRHASDRADQHRVPWYER
jgi:magnesium-transporting ATPase (P-type)